MRVFTKPEDLSAEVEGVWVAYGTGGVEFLIARMGSPANRKAYERAQARFRQKIQRKRLTADERVEIMANTLADSILLDWRGPLQDADGNPLTYSRDLAYSIMKYDQDAREFVVEQADLAENFRQEEIDTMGKSLANGSPGTPGTAET